VGRSEQIEGNRRKLGTPKAPAEGSGGGGGGRGGKGKSTWVSDGGQLKKRSDNEGQQKIRRGRLGEKTETTGFEKAGLVYGEVNKDA